MKHQGFFYFPLSSTSLLNKKLSEDTDRTGELSCPEGHSIPSNAMLRAHCPLPVLPVWNQKKQKQKSSWIKIKTV